MPPGIDKLNEMTKACDALLRHGVHFVNASAKVVWSRANSIWQMQELIKLGAIKYLPNLTSN